jgi:hypothetical protein
MRMLIVLAVAAVIAALGFGVKTVFIPSSADNFSSITAAMATSNTLSPHEIHLKSDEFSFVFLRRLRFGDGRRPIAL